MNTADIFAYATTTGGHARATTTGNDAHALTAGNDAHALAAGFLSSAYASAGFLSSAYASAGFLSCASAPGENAIAAAFGANSSARAANGGFIVLAQYNPDGDTVVAVKTAQAGKDGIKPDTWYKLSHTGEFVEVEVE